MTFENNQKSVRFLCQRQGTRFNIRCIKLTKIALLPMV